MPTSLKVWDSTRAINQSRVATLRHCPQAHQYHYVENLVPVKNPRPFAFGTLAHKVLETYAETGSSLQALEEIRKVSPEDFRMFNEEKEYYGDILNDIYDIMYEYFRTWNPREFKFIKVAERNSEHEFCTDILYKGKKFKVKGTIDAIVQTINGKIWLVENKTFGTSLPSEDDRWRNLQTSVYIKVALKLKMAKRIDGILWNYILSKPPTVPQELKDGGLSQREIITLPLIVERELGARSLLSSPSYTKLRAMAETGRGRYFERIYNPVAAPVVESLWRGFLDTALLIVDNRLPNYRNIGRHCGWCQYERLCRTELTGGDLEYVKEKEYKAGDEDQPGSKKHLPGDTQ